MFPKPLNVYLWWRAKMSSLWRDEKTMTATISNGRTV